MKHFLKSELIKINKILNKYDSKLKANELFMNSCMWLGMNINGLD
jgi:hypothetical protein